MERERKSLCSKVMSFLLAAVMMVSVIGIMPESVSAATEIALKGSGKTVVSITDEQSSTITQDYTWLKIKPKANGYLQLKFASGSAVASYSAGKVILCNAGKSKVLSTEYTYSTNETTADGYTECYGLKKGTTYYIRLNAYNGVKITATFKKITTAGGKNQKKAKKLNKNKNFMGLIMAGQTKAAYYKFTLTKRQKITFNVTPYLTDSVNVTLSGPGVYTRTLTIGSSIWGQKDPITTTGAVKEGTYYVKIQPTRKTTCGYYKISWK